MAFQQLLLLIGAAIMIGVIISGVSVAAWLTWRSGAGNGVVPATEPRATQVATVPQTAADEAALEVPRPGTYDRVVRVMAFLFLAAVAMVVAVTGAYPDTAVAIELLVAAGILFVVFIQDLLPAGVLGRARYWIEAIAAIGILTVLVGLTGGLSSPFFPGFFLLVGGASLSVEGTAPVLLAAVAGLAYALVALLMLGGGGIGPSALAWLVFNIVALGLLAYIATVAGREQRNSREAAIRLSRFDPLTGIYNRSYFFSVMEREIHRAARIGRGFSVLMLDLDDLKPVNDMFGHQYGDRLLRAVTELIGGGIRSMDVAARYGGDEFVVLLPETDASGAFVVAEKLRADIAALGLRVDDRTVRTSVSVGVAAYPEDGTTIDVLIASVDAAMYEAKRRGKNQMVGYSTRTERIVTAIEMPRPTYVSPGDASREIRDQREVRERREQREREVRDGRDGRAGRPAADRGTAEPEPRGPVEAANRGPVEAAPRSPAEAAPRSPAEAAPRLVVANRAPWESEAGPAPSAEPGASRSGLPVAPDVGRQSYVALNVEPGRPFPTGSASRPSAAAVSVGQPSAPRAAASAPAPGLTSSSRVSSGPAHAPATGAPGGTGSATGSSRPMSQATGPSPSSQARPSTSGPAPSPSSQARPSTSAPAPSPSPQARPAGSAPAPALPARPMGPPPQAAGPRAPDSGTRPAS